MSTYTANKLSVIIMYIYFSADQMEAVNALTANISEHSNGRTTTNP